MSAPAISIVLPAYNCEKYLGAAIESMLHQSFADFEFIIINDGSTDGTERVILSYADPRIVYIKNYENKGLVSALNIGVDQAKGTYIARMDGDDISMPDRLQKQLEHLIKNELIDVLATQVTLINEDGKHIGFWEEDKKHTDVKSIKEFLPVNNCIAHPTVMIKREILKKYRYQPLQKLSEDYDLWLRIIAEGGIIDKLPLPLLKHRILQTSFTRTRNINVFYKLLRVKWQFVKSQLLHGRFNKFIFLTLIFSIADGIKGTGKAVYNFFRRGPVSC